MEKYKYDDGPQWYPDSLFPARPRDGTETNPRDGTVKPRDGTTRPRDGTIKPRDGTIRPRDGTIRSRDGTTKPRDGTSRPRDGTIKPRDGTFSPRDGTNWPPGLPKDLKTRSSPAFHRRKTLWEDRLFEPDRERYALAGMRNEE